MDKETGLTLDRPRLLLKEDGVLPRAVFYGALMLLGGLGGWGCFITAFNIPVYTPWLIIAGLVSTVFCVWRYSRRRRWPVSLAGWAVWLLTLVFRFDPAAHGAVRTVNFMLELYGAKLNYDLPVLRMPYSAGSPQADIAGECTSFMALLLFPFFWAMARMWMHSRNNRAPFGLTGMLLLFPMSFSILPAGWAFAALLMFWCMLLLMAPSLSGSDGVIGRFHKKGYKASGVAVARPMALLLLLGVGLCMWLVYLYAPPDTYERPKLAESMRTMVREGVGSSRYIRGGQGNSNKEVQLRSIGRRDYTGETVLRVRFDWQQDSGTVGAFPRDDGSGGTWWETYSDISAVSANADKEYLKSFVGAVYTGHSWERLGPEGREELGELELTAQNQISRYKHELFSVGRDKLNCYRLSVQNLGANPRCVYIPASLKSGEDELSQYGIELVDDGYAKSASFIGGTGEYELTGEPLPLGFNYFSRVISYLAAKDYGISSIGNLGLARVGNPRGDEYSILIRNDGTRELLFLDSYWLVGSDIIDLFDSINSQQSIAGAGWPADLWEMPEFESWEGLDIEQRELLRDVEAYNKFVYEHYLEVPKELRGFLEDFKDAYGLDPEGRFESGPFQMKGGAQAYAGTIAEKFQQYFDYTLDPAQPPEGQDFVEFFLGESQEGYCVHFATAAVMLLRAAGYPARYAEGYVVPTGGDGLGGRAEWVDVPDYNAHAWVEIYCGGTGWVPVEVTPAAADNPAAFYNATIPENPGELIPTPLPVTERPTLPPRNNPLIDEELSSPTPGPSASAAPSPGVHGSVGGDGGGRGLLRLVWFISIAAGIAGVIMLQRLLRVKKRQRDFSQADRNAAGLRVYAYLMKLYEKEVFCGSREEPPKRWKELAEKARFSQHMLSTEELSELVTDAGKLREKLKSQLPRGQKVICWLTGLI